MRVKIFLFTLPILHEIYRKYSWECIQNMWSFNFYLIFPYFSTSNCIGIVLNWKLRRCVVADDKIYRAIWRNSCGGKNYLTVSCKMYKNILLHLQVGYINLAWQLLGLRQLYSEFWFYLLLSEPHHYFRTMSAIHPKFL